MKPLLSRVQGQIQSLKILIDTILRSTALKRTTLHEHIHNYESLKSLLAKAGGKGVWL